MSKTIELKIPAIPSSVLVWGGLSVIVGTAATVFGFAMTDGRDMTEGRAALSALLWFGMTAVALISGFFCGDAMCDTQKKSTDRLRQQLDAERDEHGDTYRLLIKARKELAAATHKKMDNGDDS